LVAALSAVIGLAACGDPLEPVLTPVPDDPQEETLVDFSGGSLTESSAFDVISAGAVRTDQFSGWDFVFEILPTGDPVLWPRAALTDGESDAGIQPFDGTFEDLRTAPESGYTTDEPVSIGGGDVLAIQSRRDPVFASVRCRRFAKIEVLSIDAGEGVLTLRHLVNPNCEKRTLVPGAEE
jgi:hypothetical protein